MKKEELEKLAEKYQAKADADYQNYQETGMTRYGTAYRKNEDMADALRMAAAAADNHAALLSIRSTMSNFAWRAKMISIETDDEKKSELTYTLIRDLAAYGRMMGLIGGD